MCGIPIFALETYIGKLISKGEMVAVCEQIPEDNEILDIPSTRRKRGGLRDLKFNKVNGIVRREITRLVSPGTLIEDHLLRARSNNYLLSIFIPDSENYLKNSTIGISWIDVSTGDFQFSTVQSVRDLRSELHRLQPAEVICSYKMKAMILLTTHQTLSEAVKATNEDQALEDTLRSLAKEPLQFHEKQLGDCLSPYRVTPRSDSNFDSFNAQQKLCEIYGISSINELPVHLVPEELSASGALFDYIIQTQKGKLPSLSAPKKHFVNNVMFIDASSYNSLELISTSTGEKTKTLLFEISLLRRITII